MWLLIQKGGPVMAPLLLTSLVGLTTVIERILFIVREKKRRSPESVANILEYAEKGDFGRAIKSGQNTSDFVARVLVYGLLHREKSLSSALLQAANIELKRFGKGLPTLDTIITLAPLLGLLGTVTGMIRALGVLGQQELEMSTVITGGIAEAFITTAFGLSIAIVSLIPFNFLNARLEQARHEIEDASTHLELSLRKPCMGNS